MHNQNNSKSYKDLVVWQKSILLTVLIYEITQKYPDEEKFGLTSQMRRCSVSIASNIAEGSSRNSSKHFSHFLAISQGSAMELETQLEIASRLPLSRELDYTEINNLLTEILKMLYALIRSLPTKN